jgi:hypothetical protein
MAAAECERPYDRQRPSNGLSQVTGQPDSWVVSGLNDDGATVSNGLKRCDERAVIDAAGSVHDGIELARTDRRKRANNGVQVVRDAGQLCRIPDEDVGAPADGGGVCRTRRRQGAPADYREPAGRLAKAAPDAVHGHRHGVSQNGDCLVQSSWQMGNIAPRNGDVWREAAGEVPTDHPQSGADIYFTGPAAHASATGYERIHGHQTLVAAPSNIPADDLVTWSPWAPWRGWNDLLGQLRDVAATHARQRHPNQGLVGLGLGSRDRRPTQRPIVDLPGLHPPILTRDAGVHGVQGQVTDRYDVIGWQAC